MRNSFLTLLVVVPLLTVVAFGADNGTQANGKVTERTVIVPEDNAPFKVQRSQRVRLIGEGIAGSKIVATVDGPATVAAENSLLTMKSGHVLIGMATVEYEIKPTGRGTVKVKITSTPPTGAKPTVKNYTFEVK